MHREVASTDFRSLNKNDRFVHVFGRITNLSEEGRSQVAEAIWSAGYEHEGGASLDLLRKAASARLDLSSDTQTNRERVLQMRKDIVRISRDMAARDATFIKAHQREVNIDKNMLATALYTLNFFEEAIAMYQEALDFWQGQDGEELQEANTYNGIGIVLYSLGRFNESIQVLNLSLKIRKRVLGETHVDVARSYYNIGCSHHKLDRFAEALECYERDLSIIADAKGQDSYDTCRAHEGIGQVYNDLGRNDDALRAHYKCLSVNIQRFGTVHLNVANSLCNIARSLKKLGR